MDSTQVYDDEHRLFELLDVYVASLSGGGEGLADPPAELLERFPDLADLLDCIDTLDSMAVNTSPMQAESVPAPVDSPSGTQAFGRYELLREIGRGGMGIVFEARQTLLNARVALKVVRSSQFASQEEIRRFYAEARAAAGLRHPHIVCVHDVGECGGQHYLTMDLIQGSNLSQLMSSEGRMEPRRAAEMLATVARAVGYLHQHNIVHRDLKPSNIMLDEDGVPHVTDFGLAKVFDSGSTETTSGAIIGTPSYMSPEQAAGRSAKVSVRSDVYSLGAILYEMLTGRPPFCEENPLDTLLLVLESEPESPRRIVPSVPVELEEICLACLEKDPDDRLDSADRVADEIERYLKDEPLSIPPRSWWDRMRGWTRREPALASRLAIVAAGTCVVEGNYLLYGAAISPTEHGRVMGVIAAWALACVICQKLMNRTSWASQMPYVWAVTDVIFLTTLLTIARGESIGPILIGYPLLVVASGLWFEKRVVALMTALACLGYIIVDWWREETGVPGHYPYIYAVVLCGIGYIVAYQVDRIRTLSRYFERRK